MGPRRMRTSRRLWQPGSLGKRLRRANDKHPDVRWAFLDSENAECAVLRAAQCLGQPALSGICGPIEDQLKRSWELLKLSLWLSTFQHPHAQVRALQLRAFGFAFGELRNEMTCLASARWLWTPALALPRASCCLFGGEGYCCSVQACQNSRRALESKARAFDVRPRLMTCSLLYCSSLECTVA